jgi:hypothetical protein
VSIDIWLSLSKDVCKNDMWHSQAPIQFSTQSSPLSRQRSLALNWLRLKESIVSHHWQFLRDNNSQELSTHFMTARNIHLHYVKIWGILSLSLSLSLSGFDRMLARQAIYHLSHSTSSLFSFSLSLVQHGTYNLISCTSIFFVLNLFCY